MIREIFAVIKININIDARPFTEQCQKRFLKGWLARVDQIQFEG